MICRVLRNVLKVFVQSLHDSIEGERPRPAKRSIGRQHRHLNNHPSTRPLRPLERTGHSQHADRALSSRVDRPQLQHSSTRPLQHDRVHSGVAARLLLHRVPHVRCRRVVLVRPGAACVDGVTVDAQPRSDVTQSLLEQRDDSPVRSWSDVHQNVSTTT